MILPGSYANGFAPRDGQPLYPELWRGCVGAWAPCLGPTGLTLRDWSGLKNTGTLTNMAAGDDWISSQGRYALDFDGTNDYVTAPQSTRLTSESCVSAWVFPRSVATYQVVVAEDADSVLGGTRNWVFAYGVTTGKMVTVSFVGGSAIVYESDTIMTANVWQHIAWNRSRRGVQFFHNGVAASSLLAWEGSLNVNAIPITMGRRDSPGAPQYMNGLVAGVMVHNRELHMKEIRLLAMRSTVAFDMAPRRRSSISVAAFNRRRRLLVGAGT